MNLSNNNSAFNFALVHDIFDMEATDDTYSVGTSKKGSSMPAGRTMLQNVPAKNNNGDPELQQAFIDSSFLTAVHQATLLSAKKRDVLLESPSTSDTNRPPQAKRMKTTLTTASTAEAREMTGTYGEREIYDQELTAKINKLCCIIQSLEARGKSQLEAIASLVEEKKVVEIELQGLRDFIKVQSKTISDCVEGLKQNFEKLEEERRVLENENEFLSSQFHYLGAENSILNSKLVKLEAVEKAQKQELKEILLINESLKAVRAADNVMHQFEQERTQRKKEEKVGLVQKEAKEQTQVQRELIQKWRDENRRLYQDCELIGRARASLRENGNCMFL